MATFSPSRSFLFWNNYISTIIQCITFWVFFFPLSPKPFKFILVGVVYLKFISLIAGYYFMVCMCHSLCIHSPTERQLGCFQFFVSYKVPGNVGIQSFEWKSESHSVVSDSLRPHELQYLEFSRLEYWSGKPFPSPGVLPNPGMELRSPTLLADILPAEPQGKPKNAGVGNLSLFY